jgi:hypothetical protein
MDKLGGVKNWRCYDAEENWGQKDAYMLVHPSHSSVNYSTCIPVREERTGMRDAWEGHDNVEKNEEENKKQI